MPNLYGVLADIVLVTHVAFVLFVVAGLFLIVIGGIKNWRWVRNHWFRFVHLLGIGIVVAQAWAGIICPLTTLEMWLREKGGGAVYQGSFIEHWLQKLLYYDAPDWVFITAYTVFGLMVVSTFLLIPPHFHGDE